MIMLIRIFLILIITILTGDLVFAQQKHPADSTKLPADSTKLYKDIQTFSKRNKITLFLHKLLFKPLVKVVPKKRDKQKVYQKLIQKQYRDFEGKIIRHIFITTLDPFGYNVSDTTISTQNVLTNTGNKIHARSQNFTIRNLLLIHQNEIFDSLLVKESERLVRTSNFVHDVTFNVKAVSKNSDSVDIYIRELDKWSIIPQISASASGFGVNLTDKNFSGLGHEFNTAYNRRYVGSNALRADYSIPNIRNTFVSGKVHFDFDGHNSFNKALTIDRPFFSPFAKWAAGLSLEQQFIKDSIPFNNMVFRTRKFKFNTQDLWAGKAIQVYKGNSAKSRTTNLIFAARYLRIRYIEKPPDDPEMRHLFSDEDFFFISTGLSARKYVQDKFIFKYGLTEDVPVGKVFSLTGGYQAKNNAGRLYLGGRISFGQYLNWGYLSTSLEYETFFREKHTEQGNFTISSNYFTGIAEIGKWKFRQFVKPQVTIGINRLETDSVTLNDGYGISGFNSSVLTGISRMVLTLQTQIYSPVKLAGFSFGPYLICSFGMLGDQENGFKNNKVYSQIGIGTLIKNEHLVFNTFQFSVSFYPIIPGRGSNIFKANSFKTSDFGFMDFETGKPSPMIFQ